ncbi:MAG: outer membrane protein assembly factor, partial [Flammeovirgaceae bacterium]|nr:outer membrane protein assembly factor [Flammeovirgaceae bacterium]
GTIFNFIDTKPVDDQGLQTFKYLRGNVDLRQITSLTKVTSLAFRLNGGVAYSYASSPSLPYEKFFFAGGSNSVRAWRPRRLGPGSFRPNFSADPDADGIYDYNIEQPGEVLLEASIELRNKLFGFVEGAVFIDAGNVWTIEERLKTDPETSLIIQNGNSKFNVKTFAEEIGVGTGFGLRFDFTFLILRFDVGIKVYDPARIEGQRFVLDDVKFFKPFTNGKEPVIYNVGIGYPF